MKTMYQRLSAFMFFMAIISIPGNAEDLRKIVSLSGYWKFSIGDDINWANPLYDDSDWDEINVPEQWEDQGYNEYNGYAWYRKTIRIGDIPAGGTIFLMLGRIDDADMVYLNGKLLGKSGKFPPDFVTAYDKVRKYAIPSGYLKTDADNVIAVRVYDTYLDGGITDGPAGIYYDADNDYLSLKLNGRWKFHTGDSKEWKSPDFNDVGWKAINVPSEWENEGYAGYNGYAWYRLKFRLPQNFSDKEMYLSLGKIDDVDEVYLNGLLIGSVYNLKKDRDYRRSGWEFNARRLYKIKEGSLKRNAINTIAIRVYDGQLRGGIYEGPVGIMSAENYRRYRNKYYSNQPFWDQIYDMIVED